VTRGGDDPRAPRWVPGTARRLAVAGLLVAVASTACGKKGPPLPPFIRIAAQPAGFVAERRGETVELRFSVPGANTDGSRPANVEQVEVYAITAPTTISDQDFRRFGELIATIDVNPPAEPDGTARPAIEGGIDQGAPATVTDTLDAAAYTPAKIPVATAATTGPPPRPGTPLLPPPVSVPSRLYMAVPIGGRTGTAARAVVPLVPAPEAPTGARVTYDENELTVTWMPSTSAAVTTAPGGLLISRPLIGAGGPVAYHVYEVVVAEDKTPTERRLTDRPSAEQTFTDPRVEFGEERCYTIRAVQRIGTLSVESEGPASACATMVDTFAPRAPTNVTTVPSDGAISLIWDPSDAADLAGYLVMRGQPGSAVGTFSRVTPKPITETSFRDIVSSGTRAAYSVHAVDEQGNISAPSDPVEDTAR